MAVRSSLVMQEGEAVVNAFLFDDTLCSEKNTDFKIKVFDDYTAEWADFIVRNRRNRSDILIHPYDIVIGPIADDTVGVQIRRYIEGYLSAEKLVEELKFHGDRAVQYFFATERAINLLKPIEP